MKRPIARFVVVLAVCIFFVAPGAALGLTAEEILKKSISENLTGGFRLSLKINVEKGKKKTAKHVLWVMGQVDEKSGAFFIEFEAPEESKGLRFLFHVEDNKVVDAYMYLPATGKTLPIATDDPEADIGGTGLTVGDLQSLAPQGSEKAKIDREEKVDGKDCYVITMTPKGETGPRSMWVLKEGYQVIKSLQMGKNGKPERIFKVAEFFKTDQGKIFPRKEIITVPGKKLRITIVQENAVFGIEIPKETLDAKTFGKHKWRI